MRTSEVSPAPPDRYTRNVGDKLDWSELLVDAVQKPGVISDAYRRFWNYSVGNQILAVFECMLRGIELGPINTFLGWIDLGRHVKKGERAITLCMPITVKRRRKANDDTPAPVVRTGDGAERQVTGPGGQVAEDGKTVQVTVFTFKARWFVLSQTEGAEYIPPELPTWTERQALYTLGIERVPFNHPNGNCQGYAQVRTVSVSPIAALPHKTLLHELAHIVLGHTEEGIKLDDHELTPRNLREVEAECVALICCESLSLSGSAESRGYVQHWLGNQAIPERSAQKIFKAADTILKAGRPCPEAPSQSDPT